MNRRNFVRSLAAGAVGLGTTPEAAFGRTLAEHRIARMDVRQLRYRYPRFVGRNAFGKPAGRGSRVQVRIITTDKGAQGWAQSWLPEERVAKYVGAPLSDLFDSDGGPLEETGGWDQALYDLAGNIIGKPVYEMLGGKGPREIPVYSGAIYFDDLTPEDQPRGVTGVVASCQQDYDHGYRAFKLKIGRGFKWMDPSEGRERDIRVTLAVRERFPDCKILVDANDGYTCDDFLRYVTAVKDCELFWIEEPFRENRDELLRLKEHLHKVGCKALIAEGEGRIGHQKTPWLYGGYTQEHMDTLFTLAEEKLVDVFLLDLNIIGFSRWRRVMPELEKATVKASPHTWAWPLRSFYTAHIAAGLGNVVIVEGVPGSMEGVDLSPYRMKDGNIVMPTSAGFGLSLPT